MRQQRDSMVFRFKADPSLAPDLDSTQIASNPLSVVRVLSELEFINEFKRAPGHQYWQTIELMQTTLKITSLSGLGKQYNFTFNAPCFKVLPKQGREKPTNDHPQGAEDSDLDSMIWPTPE